MDRLHFSQSHREIRVKTSGCCSFLLQIFPGASRFAAFTFGNPLLARGWRWGALQAAGSIEDLQLWHYHAVGTSEHGAVKLPSAAALSGWELSSLHGAKLGSRGLGRRQQQEGPPGWADSLWGVFWRAGAEWFCTGHADRQCRAGLSSALLS